jgi:hypothetical protein
MGAREISLLTDFIFEGMLRQPNGGTVAGSARGYSKERYSASGERKFHILSKMF